MLFLPRALLALLSLTVAAASQSAAQAAVQTATLTGTVTDPDAALLTNAQLTLISGAGTPPRITATDSTGRFTFLTLAPGAYTLAASAPRFATVRTPLTLSAGQSLELPAILLPVAVSQDITVQPSRAEMAARDLHQEETQRSLGLIPNFYVTYNWHAPPLASRQKLQLAVRSVIDPVTFLISGAAAGVQQAADAFPGYHQGAAGYFKRFGANQADATVGTLLGGAIFPILFRQDPRYFYLGHGTNWHRTVYALSTAVITRGDNGRRQPNYSGIFGDVAAGAVSNLYYPASDRNGASLTIINGLINAAGDGVGNVLQEFFVRRFTPHLPPPRP